MPTFVPRTKTMAALDETFGHGSAVVVVTGPVGAGKSALARHWLATLDEPSVAVSLDDASDTDTLSSRLGASLGMAETLGVDEMARALESIDAVTVLLDDFDRLVGTAEPALETWCDAAPHLRWVITTRRRPRIDAQVVEVGAMTPDEALALFEDRARQARPTFALDDAVTEVVRQLADELDRIPLAIELAAGRVHALGPAEILARLPQRFRILRGQQRTLQGAIELSWEMLDDAEQRTLAQCAVFRGGFSASAAEAVVELDDEWVVDVLAKLVDQSLLRSSATTEVAGEVRFDMLTSIREFVGDRVEEVDAVRSRHARYYLDTCREWAHAADRRDGGDARARLELERDNLLAAFAWATDPKLIVDLALTLDKTFRRHGTHDTWRDVLARAATVATPQTSQAALVERALGEFHLLSGDLAAAESALERAAQSAVGAQEHVTLAWTVFLQGELQRRAGAVDDALDAHRRVVELAREHGLPALERMALGHSAACLVDVGELRAARSAIEEMERLGPGPNIRDEAYLLKRVAYAQHYLGNTDEHRRLTTDALRLARLSGDRRLEAVCIQGLGDAAFVCGDPDGARERWAEALVLHRTHGSGELEAALLGNLGSLEHRQGQLAAAREAYTAAIRLHRTVGARPYEAVVRFGLGVLELELGHLDDAISALERCVELNRQIGNDPDLGSALLVLAWATELTGADAADLRTRARATFERSEESEWAALCDMSPELQGATSSTVRECAAALRGEADLDLTHLHVRAARARAGGSSPDTAEQAAVDLRVGDAGNWFEVGAERVSLRRRRAPRHIFARLVELRVDEPGRAVDVYEAFEIGWPDEIATPEAAADRVYWAVRTLRKLGLEDVLVTSGDGYLIGANVTIEVE